jgi:hypothetical protein
MKGAKNEKKTTKNSLPQPLRKFARDFPENQQVKTMLSCETSLKN